MSWSRRQFICSVPVAGTAFVLMPSVVFRNPPVLTLHLDQPYIDPTGTAEAYVPPDGMRSAAALGEMSDMERSRYFAFI